LSPAAAALQSARQARQAITTGKVATTRIVDITKDVLGASGAALYGPPPELDA
jgi:hypothetical protein